MVYLHVATSAKTTASPTLHSTLQCIYMYSIIVFLFSIFTMYVYIHVQIFLDPIVLCSLFPSIRGVYW